MTWWLLIELPSFLLHLAVRIAFMIAAWRRYQDVGADRLFWIYVGVMIAA